MDHQQTSIVPNVAGGQPEPPLHPEIARHLADLDRLDREDLNYELRKYGLRLVEVNP